MTIILIIIAAFFIRLIPYLWLPVNLSGDALVYNDLALDIVRWGILTPEMLAQFPLKDHPVYPAFLAAIYSLFGQNIPAIILIQSLLGALLCLVVYKTSLEYFNKRISLISAIIVCLYPVFIRLPSLLLSENIFVFLFTLTLYFAIKYVKNHRMIFLSLSSLFLGMSVLTRSVVILFAPSLSLLFFLSARKHLGLAKNFFRQIVFFILFACVIIPWSMRNYYVSGGQVIPVTEAPDRGLYNSFCPYQGKIFGIRPDNDPVMIEARSISSFKERRSFFFRKTVDFVRNNPYKTLKLEILKVLYLWSPLDWEILGNGIAVYNFGFAFLAPFFFYGIMLIFRKLSYSYLTLLMPVLYFQIIHLVYFALPRFRIGFEPSLIIVSAFGLNNVFSKVLNKKKAAIWISIYFLFNFALFHYSSQAKLIFRQVCIWLKLW
ncbi:MAG: hypothetical protein C4533_04195 [Candidatus Omnitrophota bacterium]|jgi:4-amino-4-deoxy-L-arabinose transferase-like glycosyltransferase|nr:MAG: hypothetical protein C4533_04195 [Candidatus Omnitrophota bacterium]